MKERKSNNHLLAACAAGIIGLAVSSMAAAVNLTPAGLSPDPRPGSQTPPTFTGKYAWDWDVGRPTGSSAEGGAPGYGSSAWYFNSATSAYDYSTVRLFPENIFGTPIKLSDLDNVSYYSNLISGIDWQVRIYTKPTGGSFYDHRVNFNRGTDTGAGWTKHDITTLGVGSLRDSSTGYVTPTPSWSDIIASYGSEEIEWIDIGASFLTSPPASFTYLDGLTLSLNDGRSAQVNLSVPEPTTLALMGLSLAGLGFSRRRRRKA